MTSKKQVIISFDLDFTLVNNKEGILHSFIHTFEKFNIPLIDTPILEKTIGEPLSDVFQRYSKKNPKELVQEFRNYYEKKGIYQVKLYKGVLDMLNLLKDNEFILGVITSKKEELAKVLLNHLKILGFFEFVIGETDEIKNKLSKGIQKFFLINYPRHNIIIVGDHINDRRLAEILSCPFIGVLTGNHSQGELNRNSNVPVVIIKRISDLNLHLISEVLTKKII